MLGDKDKYSNYDGYRLRKRIDGCILGDKDNLE
jgi:hypothetical protein